MKEMCEFCEKMVEMQPTYTTMYIGVGKNEDVPIEILYMRCPECGDGHYLNPSAYELFQIKKMLIRGKNNLLHWTDIIEFQKQMQWSDEELSEFVHQPLPISVRAEDDLPLEPEYDHKLREEMAKQGYKPKYDKIDLLNL